MKYKFITIKQIDNEKYNNRPVYRVINNKTGNHLAIISYYEPYQNYVFESREGCVFGYTCLNDVLNFITKIEKDL